ncbi:hypothetical protein [Faecalibacterium prausnitzii]|jgi:hypothetical protein|uniref:hypothetical protein n=1 Tax=Faecalibacterium prausnitzii TaxID=853 RepID=UPI0022E283EB|nr:hypothetical protein [Faecalibacterium prausnitzii]
MAKAEIHAKLVDENGKLGVEVEANGYGLDLLDMTACIAADVIAADADDEGVIKRRKQYFFVATENNLRDKSNGKNMVVQAEK